MLENISIIKVLIEKK